MFLFKNRIGVRAFVLVLAVFDSLYLWLSPNAALPFYVHLTVFLMGPGLVMLDMFTPPSASQWCHASETSVRLLVLMSSYFLLPSELLNTVIYLLNFVLMYAVVVLSFQKFIIKPDHWLRHDYLFNTGFLSAIIMAHILEWGLSPYVRGAGLFFLNGLLVCLTCTWRYALWKNASQELSPAQHAAVWPTLAKRSIPADFWEKMYNYSLQYPSSMPLAALRVLDVPVLLSFFKWTPWTPPGINGDEYRYFKDRIQSMINEKEPRAIVFWQLYSSSEAASYIERIEDFTASAKNEIVELPLL